MINEQTTIAVAMSGGVDSSTVAAILAHSGEQVVGLTLQLWDQTRLAGRHGIPDAPKAGRCCSLDDVYDARHVAEHLGIPYYVVNQEERFEQDVVRPFVREYLAGRTPIPCSLCNDHLKFDQLLKTARSIGASRIATGHYAVNEYDAGRKRWILKRPADLTKDQTYFLFGLTQEQLAHTLFPLGRLTKPEVREVARKYGLRLAEKPDSQEICFVTGGDYRTLVGGQSPPGRFVDRFGHDLGESPPLAHFTVGQRRGIGLAAEKPYYVLELRPGENTVVIGHREELEGTRCLVEDARFVSGLWPTEPFDCSVRIRAHGREVPAEVVPQGNGEAEVHFLEPQTAIAPGQSAVFYAGDECLGGGIIA